MSTEDLSQRAQQVLTLLVKKHIEAGEPVGSKVLCQDATLGVSSATVRNVMSDLEGLGFITSPHTSAGRIPTPKGYRYFVDTLLAGKQPVAGAPSNQMNALKRTIVEEHSLEHANALLANMTQMAALVTVPTQARETLRQIEFISLGEKRILVVLVINQKEVQNRVINTEKSYTESELTAAANFINQNFGGRDLAEIRQLLIEKMRHDKADLDDLMKATMEMADVIFEPGSTEPDYLMAGETNLIGHEDLSDLQRLRQLFDAFSQKREILHLLDQCTQSNGVQIFIGSESQYEFFDGVSLVAAPYTQGEETIGVLGVIGPTRMAYDRVIPIVDVTSKLLSAALKPE